MSDTLEELELYAWVGEDEYGSGEIGLKQAVVPAGTVAMVAIDRQKVDRPFIQKQLQAIADQYGKPRYLVRFVFAEVVASIEPRERKTDHA
jgi:tRNA A37 threonylcarbamoyladenosine dehydratase